MSTPHQGRTQQRCNAECASHRKSQRISGQVTLALPETVVAPTSVMALETFLSRSITRLVWHIRDVE
jgi:hypothetical protein